MYLELFLADLTVFRVFWGILQDFAEIPEFRGSTTARNIRSPDYKNNGLKSGDNRLSEVVVCERFLLSCDWEKSLMRVGQP